MTSLIAFSDVQLVEMFETDLDCVQIIEDRAYSYPWTRSMFQSSLKSKDLCLKLVVDDQLAGYAILSFILDEAHLLNICVDPCYQGQGLGRKILQELIKIALKKRCVMFFLEVRVSNESARQLYFSEGFNEVGVRPNYYPAAQGKEDAVLMTLDLSVDVVV